MGEYDWANFFDPKLLSFPTNIRQISLNGAQFLSNYVAILFAAVIFSFLTFWPFNLVVSVALAAVLIFAHSIFRVAKEGRSVNSSIRSVGSSPKKHSSDDDKNE